MSKIGIKPIALPSGVTATLADGVITVQGPKGTLRCDVAQGTKVEVVENEIQVSTVPTSKINVKAFHGLMRSLVNNMVIGVSEGYAKRLKLIGTGYRVAQKGRNLSITVGFSHPVDVAPAEGLTLAIDGNDTIIVSGIDKQAVGQMAADIRHIRPPEPYKGKGIRYEDEAVHKKQGKTVAK